MSNICRIARQLWPTKVRHQLICGVALVHLLLMTFFVVDLVQRQRFFLKQQSLEQTKSLVETLAVNSTSWVLSNDVVGLPGQTHQNDQSSAMKGCGFVSVQVPDVLRETRNATRPASHQLNSTFFGHR